MRASALVELAALAATHGPALVVRAGPFSQAGLEQYWMASKARFDAWFRALKHARGVLQQGDRRDRRRVLAYIAPVLAEVFTGEALTRVWGAVAEAHDQCQRQEDSSPVTRSILIGHLEAKNRAMSLLLHEPGIEPNIAIALNRLRRLAEGWCDALVAPLLAHADVSSFASQPERAREFFDDLRHEHGLSRERETWSLTVAALRGAFRDGRFDDGGNPDLNARIAHSVLSCFPADLFDGTGLAASVWLARLMNTADDAAGLLDDLLEERPRRTGASAPLWQRRFE